MDAVLAKRSYGAVRTYMFDSYLLNISGFLTSFVKEGSEYAYYRTTDFHEDQQQRGAVLSGYYKVQDFSESITYPSIHTFAKLKKKRFEKFVPAENGDTVKIKVINTDLPHTFYTMDSYEVIHDTNNDYIIQDMLNKSILGTPVQITQSTGIYSDGFYANHISGIDNITDLDEKTQYLIATVFCAMRIAMVDGTVFPILLDGGPDNLDTSLIGSMVESMRTAWENDVVLNNLTFEELNAYDNQLISLYDTVFLNQISFKAEPIAKRIMKLMRIMSPSALALIDVQTKISALRIMLVGQFVDNSYYKFKGLYQEDEDFALKIVNSIDINNQTDVDYFLGKLINKKYETGNSLPPYHENLFTLLYDTLENHTFSNTSNGNNTTRFIYAILVLWTESKYNPYKNGTGTPDYTLIDNSTYDYDNNYKHYALINYISKKGWFGTFNDKFTFSFGMHANGIYYITDEGGTWVPHDPPMHFYQPISLVTYPSETDTALQIPVLDGEANGAIPLFLLKYIDDYGDNETLNVKIGIFIDVVTTVSGLGALAKLKHLRHLSKLGQVATVIESVQVIAGVANLMLSYSETCNNSEFCKKLKRVLTFIEITSLVTDPLVVAKTKKAAQEVVEEGIENGWPSGMLDEIQGTTPKDKIQELAQIDISDYINDYVDRAKKELKENIDFENSIFKSRLNNGSKPVPMNINHYSNSQMNEVLTHAAGKGLSKEDAMGMLHQGCRVRSDGYIPSVQELKNRMDNLVEVRKRGYPYTFSSKNDFTSYANNKVESVIDDFALPKEDVYYTGSSITSQSSQSQYFDTDWALAVTQGQMDSFVNEMERRFNKMASLNIITNRKAKKYIEDMLNDYRKTGNLNKRYIVTIQNNQKVTLEEVLADQLIFPNATLKTDITLVVQGVNMGYPRIKYNF